MEPALPFDRQAKQLYPVSITWQPPFTMLLDLKGHGDLQARLYVLLGSNWFWVAAQTLGLSTPHKVT
jgi:hypothetical protein